MLKYRVNYEAVDSLERFLPYFQKFGQSRVCAISDFTRLAAIIEDTLALRLKYPILLTKSFADQNWDPLTLHMQYIVVG
jgi:hypothetical protein